MRIHTNALPAERAVVDRSDQLGLSVLLGVNRVISIAAALLVILSGCGGGGEETAELPLVTGQVPDLGVRIAPEDRCAPYDPGDYSYPQSVELDIIEMLEGIYSPYTGQCFESRDETDIEHIVARSEAHDSGLCSADDDRKEEFARDLLNLTLASPEVNRYQKGAKDVAEWVPDTNVCWFVQRTLQVRRKYGLTIDQREANTADEILKGCESTELIVQNCGG